MRFCPNCGTEVDENALFCPTCGQAIDQAAEVEMPPAPAWPEPAPDRTPPPAQAPTSPAPEPDRAGWDAPAQAQGGWDAPAAEPSAEPAGWDVPAEPRPPVAAAMPPPPRAAAPERPPAGGGVNLPLTTPLTLSGWLIGGGAAVGALGALVGLFDGGASPVELVLLVALLGIAATVFFATALPHVPNLRLISLAVVLIGFGVALDRLAFGGAGIGELLLFLGTAAAAIGVIILELGRDQPVGGS